MGTTTLYARVSSESYDYVKAQSERSGIPLAAVVDAFLAEARRRGWTLGERMVQVKEPS